MDKAGGDEEFCELDATETVLRFVEKLIRVFGSEMAERLTRIPVLRYSLSDNPTVAFLNSGSCRGSSLKIKSRCGVEGANTKRTNTKTTKPTQRASTPTNKPTKTQNKCSNQFSVASFMARLVR